MIKNVIVTGESKSGKTSSIVMPMVEELIKNTESRIKLTSLLEKVYDIQRLSTRISNNSANPRDFLALRDTIYLLPEFCDVLQNFNSKILSKLIVTPSFAAATIGRSLFLKR